MIQEEVVGGGDGEDVVFGVPGGMEDFFVEVETVDGNLVLLPFVGDADFARLEDLPRAYVLARGLEGRLPLGRAAVEHPEEVVVAARHDLSIVALPSAFKLVENTAECKDAECKDGKDGEDQHDGRRLRYRYDIIYGELRSIDGFYLSFSYNEHNLLRRYS